MKVCLAKRKKTSTISLNAGISMIDIRKAIIQAVPRGLFLDLEDRLRAEALKAHEIVQEKLSGLAAKRSREIEGNIRFRTQEQGFEEVVRSHGGQLLIDGILTGTDLKIFQPFVRFQGSDVGVILGFATIPEKRKLPSKNKSRSAGVTLNGWLQPTLFPDAGGPSPTDIFILFLTARDRCRAGRIEEIAIGVVGADFKDFIFYDSLDNLLNGYEDDSPEVPHGPVDPLCGGEVVKLRKTRKLFVPPEHGSDDVADDEAAS